MPLARWCSSHCRPFAPSRLERNCRPDLCLRSRVASRRQAIGPHKGSCHVALIRKSARRRSFGKIHPLRNQPPCHLKPALDQIGMRRQPRLARKAAQNLKAADAAEARQIVEGHRLRRIVVDARPRGPSWWQTATGSVCRSSPPGRPDATVRTLPFVPPSCRETWSQSSAAQNKALPRRGRRRRSARRRGPRRD
ncbi:hypothetical protein C8J34_12117 [Rhizobium sp. PP-F2F-G36]|nr:hypothetical protein C8J34_12117 [Rhizobium sp. PP-F2F-G36]